MLLLLFLCRMLLLLLLLFWYPMMLLLLLLPFFWSHHLPSPPELQPPLKSRSGWKWAADASSHQLLDANSLELLSRKFLLFSNVFFSTTIEDSLIGWHLTRIIAKDVFHPQLQILGAKYCNWSPPPPNCCPRFHRWSFQVQESFWKDGEENSGCAHQATAWMANYPTSHVAGNYKSLFCFQPSVFPTSEKNIIWLDNHSIFGYFCTSKELLHFFVACNSE